MKKIAIEEHFRTEYYVKYLQSRKQYPRMESTMNKKGIKINESKHLVNLSYIYILLFIHKNVCIYTVSLFKSIIFTSPGISLK